MATHVSMSTRTMKPTKARYWVVVFAVTLAVLSYIDRVAISQAAPVIQRDLGFTSTQMGAVFSAFAVAYAIFEIPGGWMGDWMGARKVLMRIVIWWSAFTALTGACHRLWPMVIVRFLFGAGEAGAFPNVARVITRWFPLQERGRVRGAVTTISLFGGAK